MGGVRHLLAPDAPERLVPDTVPPSRTAQLLWFAGRATAPAGERRLALDDAGGLLSFDGRLRVRREPLAIEGREIAGAAAARGEGLWLIDGNGDVLLTDRTGRLVGTRPGPFPYADIASDSSGTAWVVRSAVRFGYRRNAASSPLLVELDSTGQVSHTVGRALQPDHVLLSDLANAGHVAVGRGAIYYAPFIRDEIIAFAPAGDTLWIARRNLPQDTPEPRFEVSGSRVVVDYHPVNLGLTLGPDGRLYVLSTAGLSMAGTRLDVFDPASGRLVRSARLASSQPTLAGDDEGRVYLVDTSRLLTGLASASRERLPPFALGRLGGGQMALDDLKGRVALINFWASWCAPCRTEMPALDSLQRTINDPDFVFLTINEDAEPAAAEKFVRRFGFGFPVLLGLGRMKELYHYVGLPFTILVDRQGRVVQRWIGFAGEDQLRAIRLIVSTELVHGASMHGPGAHHPGVAERTGIEEVLGLEEDEVLERRVPDRLDALPFLALLDARPGRPSRKRDNVDAVGQSRIAKPPRWHSSSAA